MKRGEQKGNNFESDIRGYLETRNRGNVILEGTVNIYVYTVPTL